MVDRDDELVEELVQERRRRRVIVVAAVIGIIASVVAGVGFALGEFGSGAATSRNPGGLIFFIGPFAIAMAIGYTTYFVLTYRARRR